MIAFALAALGSLPVAHRVLDVHGDTLPRVVFSAPSGRVSRQRARNFSVQVSGTDSLLVGVASAVPESLACRDGGADPFVDLGSLRWLRESHEKGRWIRRLDLDSIHRRHGGVVLRLRARELAASGLSSRVLGELEAHVGSLDVVATEVEGFAEELAVSDPLAGGPVAGAGILACPSGEGAHRDSSRTDVLGIGRIPSASGGVHVVVRRGADIAIHRRGFLSGGEDPGRFDRVEIDDWARERNPWLPRRLPRLADARSPTGYRIHTYLARGVHRPGDTLVVGCLVRARGGRIPSHLPLDLDIAAPGRKPVRTLVVPVGRDGHFQTRWVLPPDAPTGAWTLRARFDGSTSETSEFHVEVEPSRRLQVSLEDTMDGDSSRLMARLVGRWQSGRGAPGMAARVRMVIDESHRKLPAGSSWTSKLVADLPHLVHRDTTFEAVLDRDGRMEARLDLGWGPYGWKHLDYRLEGEVFLPGGRSIQALGRSGSFRQGMEPRLHVFADSQEVVFTALMLGKGGGTPLVGLPLRLRLLDPVDGRRLLDTVVGSSDSVVLPLTELAGADSRSPLWMGRVYRSSLALVGDTSVRAEAEIESGDLADAATGLYGQSWDNEKHPYTHRYVRPRIWSSSPQVPPDVGSSQAPPEPDRGDGPPDFPLDTQPDPQDPVEAGDSIGWCWRARSGSFALVQVVQGDQILLREWVRSKEGTTCWARPARPDWWPSVAVVVHSLHGDADSLRPVRQEGYRFRIRPPDPRIEVALELPEGFQGLTTNRLRVRNHTGQAGTVVVSSVDQGILDLDNHRIWNPRRTMEDDPDIGTRWWTETDTSGARVGRSFFHEAAGRHGMGLGGRLPPSLRYPGMETTQPQAWVSQVLELPDTGLVVEVPVGLHSGALRITAVAMAGHSATSADTLVTIKPSLEAMWAVPSFLRQGDSLRAGLGFLGKPASRVEVRWSKDSGIQRLGPAVSKVVLDPSGNGILQPLWVANQGGGKARLQARVEERAIAWETATEIDIVSPRSVPVSPLTGRTGLSLDLGWKTPAGARMKPWDLVQRSPFRLSLGLANPSVVPVDSLEVVFHPPAGWVIQHQRLADRRHGDFPDADTSDLRDDRWIYRVGLAPGERREIALALEATYVGTFGQAGLEVRVGKSPVAREVILLPVAKVRER